MIPLLVKVLSCLEYLYIRPLNPKFLPSSLHERNPSIPSRGVAAASQAPRKPRQLLLKKAQVSSSMNKSEVIFVYS